MPNISSFMNDTVVSTLVSELSDANRSVPGTTGIPSHMLTQTTMDNFLATWNAAIIASGQTAPTPTTTDAAAPADPPSEAPPV